MTCNTSTYHPYMLRYINMLNDHKNGTLLLTDHRVFELLAALKLRMVMWNDIKNIITARTNRYTKTDNGIDLINYDLNRLAQVKYMKNVSWRSVSTFYAYCYLLADIHNSTLVVHKNTKVAKIITDNFHVLRLDYHEELANVPSSTPGIVINKFLHSVLFIEHRILELLKYFDDHNVVDGKSKFSDGMFMIKFWHRIKYSRLLNKTRYSKLRECPTAMKLYLEYRDETIEDYQEQVNSLLRFIEKYPIEDCNKLIIWIECKQMMKCSTSPWDQLMDDEELFEDYYSYLKLINKHHDIKMVRRLIKHSSVPLLDHEFWIKCKTEKLCDTWPYKLLLGESQFYNSYHDIKPHLYQDISNYQFDTTKPFNINDMFGDE